MSQSDVRILARAVSTSKVRTCLEGAKLIKTTLDQDVSAQTVRRSLRAIGFRAVVKKRKLALKLAHRQARLRFAKRYADFTERGDDICLGEGAGLGQSVEDATKAF